MTVTINVIGGVQALVDGQPVRLRRQVQRLAAILVAAGPAGIEASALAEELWLDNPPPRWNPAVRNAVASLRSEVGRPVVTTAGGRYSLRCETQNVDAWDFLEAAASQAPTVNAIGAAGRFQPFSGLELTPLLREMSDALHSARLHMVERITDAEHLDPTFVAGLIASVRVDPFAESMSVATVGLLARLGRLPDALQLLDDIDASYRTELDTEPPRAIVLARQLVEGSDNLEEVARSPSLPTSLPSVIGGLIERPMTPHHQDLARQTAKQIAETSRSKRWSLLGLAGSGKSRFIAEVGSHLYDTGTDVMFATAIGDELSAYSPFLTASPVFRQRFLELVAPSEASVWALWSSVIEARASQGRPVAFIVDDAHLLDRSSIRLLQFMHRMELAIPITTIVVGRNSIDEHDWRLFERELLDDDRTAAITVPPLDVDDVALLVRQRWPQASDIASRDAAREVVTASAGLPMVTHLLIDGLRGPTLRLPSGRRHHQVDMATERLEAFDADTKHVLAAATLVDSPFASDDLALLLDLDPDDVDALLDDAARAAVLSNTEEPGTYRFLHDLLRQAAIGLVPRTVRAEWSKRLMVKATDPLRLARLAIAASDLLPAEETARLVAAGARVALDRNLIRRSVELAQLALSIGTEFDHETLACLAIAQAKLGALDEAAATRNTLLDRTNTPLEHNRSTQVLLDSFALVETDSPTAIRVKDFDRVETTDLTHDRRIERAVRVARLAANEGDHQRRDDELALTRSLVQSSVETAQLMFAEWTCEAQTVDQKWFERIADLRNQIGSHHAAAALTQIESLEHAAVGRWSEAERSNDILLRTATEIASPALQWQSQLASAGFAFATGDLGESKRLAEVAFVHGTLFALPLAPAARAAQAFGRALHDGTVGSWLDVMESASPDLLRNTLAMSAVARARFEVGRVDDAWQLVEPFMSPVLDRERRVAASVVAVLAPLLRQRASPGLRNECAKLLRSLGDRWVITGAGIGVHGPASRSLAIIEGDRRGLQRLRHQLADAPLWTAALDIDISRIDRER